MPKIKWTLLLVVAAGSFAAHAQEQVSKTRQEMRSLDEQVQEIKSDVLGIAAELSQLEEKLLYPSGTQVAIFVALAKGDSMRLGETDTVQILEERLLYPSDTQLAVFVSIASGETFRLDAVQLTIDGEPATRYIYSFKELEALQNGGMQRVYTGNIRTGSHELTVAVNGKLSSGKEFSNSETFTFTKEVEPRLLGLTLAANGGGASIEIGQW